jgi:hypothetical protein
VQARELCLGAVRVRRVRGDSLAQFLVRLSL